MSYLAVVITKLLVFAPQVPARVCREFSGVKWLVDFFASTPTHWKLAAGCKAELGEWLVTDYDEATQGWVAKRQKGRIVLVG